MATPPPRSCRASSLCRDCRRSDKLPDVQFQVDPHGDVRLEIKVVPGAARDAVAGTLGDALKLRIRQPPEDGRANRAVIALLAEWLSMPAGSIAIVSGHTRARKQIRLTHPPAQALTRLRDLAG